MGDIRPILAQNSPLNGLSNTPPAPQNQSTEVSATEIAHLIDPYLKDAVTAGKLLQLADRDYTAFVAAKAINSRSYQSLSAATQAWKSSTAAFNAYSEFPLEIINLLASVSDPSLFKNSADPKSEYTAFTRLLNQSDPKQDRLLKRHIKNLAEFIENHPLYGQSIVTARANTTHP